MIDNKYQDQKTPEMVERLQAFWAAQDILGTTWAPSFGQYPADLILSTDQDPAPINPSLASQEPSKHHWHTSKTPDAHYYQAQGQEPPVEDGNFYQGLVNLIGFTVAGGIFVWALLAYGLPMVIGGVLRWLGV